MDITTVSNFPFTHCRTYDKYPLFPVIMLLYFQYNFKKTEDSIVRGYDVIDRTLITRMTFARIIILIHFDDEFGTSAIVSARDKEK